MAADEIPTLMPALRDRGLAPRKGLGQHYLTDPNILHSIVAALEAPPDAVIIEVGPGPGTLTAALIPACSRLIAVELDEELAAMLARLHERREHVHIIQGNALALSPAELLQNTGGPAPYYLAGNLPYYIASPLLRHYLEAEPPPVRAVVTVQLDVARRIVAVPPDMSLLAVAVQVYAVPTIVRRLPPGAFTPPPKVQSAVLRLDSRPQPLVPPDRREAFFRIVRAGFAQKRKTLRNSLAAGLHLSPAEVERALAGAAIDPRRRAQELTLEEWLALAHSGTLGGL